MGALSKHRSWAAFYPETTFGTPPANWAADGIPIEHTALDLSAIKAARLDDPTLERDIFANLSRHKIAGLRNVDGVKMSIKLHGKGVTTAVDATATQTPLTQLIELCMGGAHYSNTTTITGGTASQPIVDDVTNIVPGCLVFVQDTTAPLPKFLNKPRMARVIAVDGGTKTLTLKPELPFTPAAGDVVIGTVTLYIDEDVLEDAVAGAGGVTTFAFFFKRHQTSTDLLFQLEGCTASMAVQGLGPGQLPTIDLTIMAANFRHGAVDGLTNPDFASQPYGHAQLCIGKDSEVVIAKYSTDDHTVLSTSAFAIEPGFVRDRIAANSVTTYRMENTATYGVEPNQTTATVTIKDYQASWYGDEEAQDEWYLMKTQPAAEGKGWGIMLPRVQIAEHPTPQEVGSIHGIQVKFQAMLPDDATGGTLKRLKQSKLLIGLC